MPASWHVSANRVIEFSFTAALTHADPFNDLEVDVVFEGPGGARRVPAFWSGGQEWRVRFSAVQPGQYSFLSQCSAPNDHGLHGQIGTVEVHPVAEGESNPLYRCGGLRVDKQHTHFEHQDGTPFFWLGDTWWMAFCGRMGWPEDFQVLTADRKAKGFTLVHLVAGLFPDMSPQDQRGWNAGGSAWEPDFARVNPDFFDQADLKLQYLVGQGLVPLIVGAWGYYLPILGEEKMRRHWRYLVARWGAYPVVWCLAGEVTMPYYLAADREAAVKMQREGWSRLGATLRAVDPFRRPVTAHSGSFGDSANELSDPSSLDFNFVQTAHGNQSAALLAARNFAQTVAKTSLKPVVNAETCYEGILGTAWQDVQRFCFWSSILSGGSGYSYGANGIWQVNQPEKPYGPSPHGMSWGDTPWPEAMRLPGSLQIGLGKGLLANYPWWRIAAHPEWVEPHAGEGDWFQPYAAGIPNELWVVYFPFPLAPWAKRVRIHRLENEASYKAFFFNPASGERQEIGTVAADAQGAWDVPAPTAGQDMVLVIEKVD